MDAAYTFASHIARTEYRDLPKEAVETAKRSILDTIGTTIAAGTVAPGCKDLVNLVKAAGGKEESTILSFGGKVPCWMAAFANGAMSHSLDYDDTLDKGSVHPGNATVPAALAVAERVGKVNGKAFLTAVVLGQDIVCRLALASTKSRNLAWNPAHLHGSFSSAAVAGKLLGLAEHRLVDAFGIALTQTGGSLEAAYSVEGALRGMYPAFSGHVGVLSALLADQGISGAKNSLEGKAGLFNAYYGGKYDRKVLLSDLGARFEGTGTSFKPWPCGRVSHPYIEGVLSIIREHSLHPRDIGRIVVRVGDLAMSMCQPLDARRAPSTSLSAKFSIPFSVAVAVVRGNPGIRDFMPERLKNPDVLRMAKKVVPEYDARLGHGRMTVPPGVVEITTTAGIAVRKRVDVAYGHPDKPMTDRDLAEKFRACLVHSAKPKLHARQGKRVAELIQHLEQVEDVAEIIQLVA